MAGGGPIDRPSGPQPPTEDASNSPNRLVEAFSHQHETQEAEPAIASPPTQHMSVQPHPYCRESRAGAKRYLEWEMVKSKRGFPVRIELCITKQWSASMVLLPIKEHAGQIPLDNSNLILPWATCSKSRRKSTNHTPLRKSCGRHSTE